MPRGLEIVIYSHNFVFYLACLCCKETIGTFPYIHTNLIFNSFDPKNVQTKIVFIYTYICMLSPNIYVFPPYHPAYHYVSMQGWAAEGSQGFGRTFS